MTALADILLVDADIVYPDADRCLEMSERLEEMPQILTNSNDFSIEFDLCEIFCRAPAIG